MGQWQKPYLFCLALTIWTKRACRQALNNNGLSRRKGKRLESKHFQCGPGIDNATTYPAQILYVLTVNKAKQPRWKREENSKQINKIDIVHGVSTATL